MHRIDLPRVVLVGRNVLDNLGEICHELGFRSALVVSGRGTFRVAGGRAVKNLIDSGIQASGIFAEDAQLNTVGVVIEEAKRTRAEAVIGVGGGRSIDVAKVAAAKTNGNFVSIPTAASHDGIASSFASVKGMDRPYTVRAVSPIAVIADSEIIAQSPYRFTASGCGDLVCKVTEVEDWKLAHRLNGDYYGDYAASLALMSGQLVMENAAKIRSRAEEGFRTILEALVSCGVAMSIAGSSRPCSGSAHLFSHALDVVAAKPALHGEQCGVGAILMARLHGLDWRRVAESLKIIGAPVTAAALGVTRSELIEALVKAQGIRPERFTILNTVKLDEAHAERLAEETGVL